MRCRRPQPRPARAFRLRGGLAALLCLSGCQLPQAPPAPREPQERAQPAPDAPSAELPAPAVVNAANGPAEPPPTGVPAARFSLCESDELPQLTWLTLGGRTIVGAHCGDRVRLLWVTGGSEAIVEVLSLAYHSERPDGRALPGQLALGDVNADAIADLVIAQPVVNARNAPAGGAVFVLPGLAGESVMLGRPRRWLGAHPISLTFAAATTPDRIDLVLVHGEDPRLGRSNELWHLPPRAASIRGRVGALGAGARLLTFLELDGDRVADPVWIDGQGAVGAQLSSTPATSTTAGPVAAGNPPAGEASVPGWPSAGIEAAAAGDLNGDGASDLVLLGSQALFLAGVPAQASADAAPGLPTSLEGVDCPLSGCGPDAQLVDVDGDGRLDLLTYQHPELVVYAQAAPMRFERSAFVKLVGEGVGVVESRLRDLDGDGALDLIVLCRSDDWKHHSLAILKHVEASTTIDLSGVPAPIPAVPLRPHYRL